jgi:lipopolysaccharide/colanic/teichoic acid biosynthesis glycosyltransferase
MLEYRNKSLEPLQFSSTGYAFSAPPWRSTAHHPDSVRVESPPDVPAAAIKRTLDVLLAFLAMVIHIVPMLLIAVAIRLDSPGPIVFRQRRVGLHGREFQMLKFRTMHHHTPCCGDCQQVSRHDPRVTRVGHWLRCLSLDELPQLVNVLRGEMSIVGPRPHAPGTRAGGRLFEDVAPRYAERHRVRPGMTGLAQVRGWRGETDTVEKLLRRIDSDLEYVATWSLALDLRIILCTMGTVLRMRNAY